MKSLREKIEAIVFAGLKPSGQKADAPAPSAETAMGRLRQRIDKWLSGGPAPSDPLYLTNRTMGQKIKSWSVVAIPLVILVGGVALSLSNVLDPPEVKPQKEPTPAEVAAKLLPNLKDIKIELNHDIDVVEVRIERTGGVHMVGTVKNKTNKTIASADLGCDLTDAGGTQLGAVTAHVENIPANGVKSFELPLKQADASFVLIREIVTH
jgi:hypothetical protein